MRYVIIFLLLISIISCKKETKAITESETNTEINIGQSVNEMWSDFITLNPEFKNEEIPDSDFFHNNKEDADRLAELVVNGKKKASSGLYSLYNQYNVAIPEVGDKQIVTDFDGKARAIIVTKRVDIIPFNKITEEYAELDMGTDIDPLKKWRKAHWGFFENFMKENKKKLTEDMLIVCESFETIWIGKH